MTLAYKSINERQKSIESKSNRLPVEERYYYKGKTNQQLHQYPEALQCYDKAIEIKPDFELAKEARDEVERIINNEL